jgi:O-antigen/teichoic acid export membrane protein
MLTTIRGAARDVIASLSANRSVKNTIWTLLAGVWAGFLIVLTTPWFVARLGLEGYGLLGLWLMMQVMMGLLDFGLGSTLIKEFADSRQDHELLEYKRDLLRTLERAYWGISATITLILYMASGWIAVRWLQSHTLPSSYVSHAIRLMALALGIQFPCTLYLNGLAGLQKHGRMSALQIMGNSLRYGGGAAVLIWHPNLIWFFATQVLAASVQTFAIRRVLWGMVSTTSGASPVFRVNLIYRHWRFSTGMALTSISALLLSNIDRIVLSKMMPTVELGKYAVAFTATGLLQLGIQPFYRAYFPRYSELISQGDSKRLRQEYFTSCKMMAIVIIPIGLIGWMFASQLFHAWLGKSDDTIISVFRWLLIGMTCSGLMWLPAAFQQAHGWTRLHVLMMTGALVIGTPVMVWAISSYGTLGATTVWVLHGVSDITLGLWLMHRHLLIGEMFGWLRTVVLLPLLVSIPLVIFSWWLMPSGLDRWSALGWTATTGLVVILVALSFSLGKHRKSPLPQSADLLGE